MCSGGTGWSRWADLTSHSLWTLLASGTWRTILTGCTHNPLCAGLAIWKVHVDAVREQRKNARVMDPGAFERLASNIGQDKRLESLPLVSKWKNPAGNEEFLIISGHHRVRAARQAGMQEIYVIADETDLSQSQIKSKQLAHNALAGHDDPVLLKEIYEEIESLDLKLAAGIQPEDMVYEIPNVKVDNIDIDLSYEQVVLLFLPTQYRDFEKVIGLLDKDSHILTAQREDFDRFKECVVKTSLTYNIRNAAAIVQKMVEIVQAHYACLTTPK